MMPFFEFKKKVSIVCDTRDRVKDFSRESIGSVSQALVCGSRADKEGRTSEARIE